MTTGTIAVNPASHLRLGGQVSFDATFAPANLDKGNSGGVRVQLVAFDPAGVLVYTDAMHHDYTFTLGGSASPWTVQGGPAHCVATLYYWGQHGAFTPLASCDFDASGSL